MYSTSFQFEAFFSLKNTKKAWLPKIIFFLDTKSTCYVLLSQQSFKPLKNIPGLVGTTHKKPEYLEMRRTVCAVTKVSTVHTSQLTTLESKYKSNPNNAEEVALNHPNNYSEKLYKNTEN